MILLELKDLDAMVEELRTLEQQRKELRQRLTRERDRVTEKIAKAEEYIKAMAAAAQQIHQHTSAHNELVACVGRYQQGVRRMKQKRDQIAKALGRTSPAEKRAQREVPVAKPASGITEKSETFREEVTLLLQRQQATHSDQHVRTLKNLRHVADTYAKQAKKAGCQDEYNEWAEIADWIGEELLAMERLKPAGKEKEDACPPQEPGRKSLVGILAGGPVSPEELRVSVEQARESLRKNPGNTAVRQWLVGLEKTARERQIDAVNLQLESEKKRDSSAYQHPLAIYWAACAARHCDTANHLQLTADLAADALKSFPEP